MNGIDSEPSTRHVSSKAPWTDRSSTPGRMREAASRMPCIVASAAIRIFCTSARVFTIRMAAICSNAFSSRASG